MTATYAVIYAAKSSEDTHGSIPTQIEDGRALAEREGWTIVRRPARRHLEGVRADAARSSLHLTEAPALGDEVFRETHPRGTPTLTAPGHGD